jgi:hypothetical protein
MWGMTRASPLFCCKSLNYLLEERPGRGFQKEALFKILLELYYSSTLLKFP